MFLLSNLGILVLDSILRHAKLVTLLSTHSLELNAMEKLGGSKAWKFTFSYDAKVGKIKGDLT